jgi:hypothetical protein
MTRLIRFCVTFAGVAMLCLGAQTAMAADNAEMLACIPEGGVDDTLSRTYCCTGYAMPGSTYCTNPGDYNNGWESCYQYCATPPVNGCVPSGGWEDTLYVTSCCSGQAVPGSTKCLDPADYGTDWKTCIQQCQ